MDRGRVQQYAATVDDPTARVLRSATIPSARRSLGSLLSALQRVVYHCRHCQLWATLPLQRGFRPVQRAATRTQHESAVRASMASWPSYLLSLPSWREVLARGQMRSHKHGAHVSTARPNVRRGMVWGGCSSLRVCACVCAALSCYLSSSSSLSPVNERDRWCTAPLHPAGSHRVTRWANGRATSTCGGDEEVSRLLRMPPAAAAGARDRLGRTLTMVMVGPRAALAASCCCCCSHARCCCCCCCCAWWCWWWRGRYSCCCWCARSPGKNPDHGDGGDRAAALAASCCCCCCCCCCCRREETRTTPSDRVDRRRDGQHLRGW